jgi:triosephosphate isomerase
MRKLIVANWKEHPANAAKARELFKKAAAAKHAGTGVVICPPVVYLEELSRALRAMRSKKDLALGAQDIFWEEEGPYTGEVGPGMVKMLGVEYVIIGHSERRKWAKETDAIINKKIKSALAAGLRVILCVGEAIAVRKKGSAAAERFVKGQVVKGLAGITKGGAGTRVMVAYEPIWAIGSGKNADPEIARAMAIAVKDAASEMSLSVGFLYGGSVDAGNVPDYVQYKEIDGALVGGASLRAAEFAKMVAAAGKRKIK